MGKLREKRAMQNARRAHGEAPAAKAKSAFGAFGQKLKWLDPFTYVDIYLMPKVNPGGNREIEWVVYLASAFVFAWVFYNAIGLALGTSSPMIIVLSGSMEPLYHRGDVLLLQHVSPEGIIVPSAEVAGYGSLEKVGLLVYAQTFCEANASPGLVECRQYVKAHETGEIDPRGFVVKEVLVGETKLQVTKDGPVVVYNSNTLGIPIVHRAVAKLHAPDGWYVLTKGDSLMNPVLDQEAGISDGAIPVSELQGKGIASIPLLGCFKLWLIDDLGSLITKGSLPPDFSGIC